MNVGSIDRILRILIGVVAVTFALLSSHPLAIWGALGVIPLFTAVAGWCPLYMPLGISTCAKEE
ncbi:DUF2892 domain-containing protein [Magnetovibrio sp. PR-2]|uniref:YgaP family membrane protein n=1 Tax=Magnetovibrio sp. PR-2 TaxID=3120356 RepID=UPI002FCDF64A